VTTFELEQEQEKAHKLAEVASRGAAIATELGEDGDRVRLFLDHYFRHVDPLDMDERSVEDLLGLVESHYRAAMNRPSARAHIEIAMPSVAADGWSAGGATVVQIVTDDRPFLVDSVTMEVLRQGWSIREVFHPQFLVRRDLGGTLDAIVTATEAKGDPTVLPESWMHLEILPPARKDVDNELIPALQQGLLEVLRLVEEAVQDWSKMITRADETVANLQQLAAIPGREAEAAQGVEFLRWLMDHHFTFLGYREYRWTAGAAGTAGAAQSAGAAQTGGAGGGAYEPVPATGLGILRADLDAPDAFHAWPTAARAVAMMITKDNHKSRVHRPAYLDYLGFRLFGPDGSVVGERRFLGLFSSSAYSESVLRVPLLRQKASEVLRRSGYDENSHGGKAIMDVLESYPRDELFQAPVGELASTVEKVAHLKERRQVRLFVRRDQYGRYLACLVYLPRDRYTTSVRNKMQDILLERLGGATIDYTARVTESVLARLHFVVRMPLGRALPDFDVRTLERELTLATRTWNDEFADLVAGGTVTTTDGRTVSAEQLVALVGVLPEGYKEDYTPKQALKDIEALSGENREMAMAMFVSDRPEDEADLRLKIFRRDLTLSLSKLLPHLTLLGVDVIDEIPYELQLPGTERAFIYDLGLRVPGGREAVATRWTQPARDQFMAAFAASYNGQSESDGFNALVMRADLDWRQVAILRTIGRYLRQGGSTYSQTYLSQALAANVDLARALITMFETKFDPARDLDQRERIAKVAELVDKIKTALNDVASLDHDRIVRSYLAVIEAAVRTNAYEPERAAISIKLLPKKIPDLPEPRPEFEIFVYSPRVEGVHLRFGSVARGGLRWSDRAEDFRTEILGLVKAQMVKNTVIVPVGAKGGFYAKRLPDPTVDRDAWMAEGIACYRLFITSLLDVTDNIVDGGVVPPQQVIRYDEDDPYLVVAADKGTATFSDIANQISTEAGFWLGDAFASGGSAGYDHKGMGITARGAWESVKRHFREMGVDCQTTDFSCVGIGDMSGDVFGNGMLLSKHIRLVAAFDHRHVFIDPDPDPERTWNERARMFALARSSWADYDTSLISEGGGIFPRTAKSIAISPQMRTVLGIAKGVESFSPVELISACLKAPVDLLWNGGIGTYVKATTETSAQVGDKANDALRVDGCELRAKCVGEGGNLGLTQLGRIEYAASGGRINTDFIDNSAGVDTSDHEVNIKILLAGEVAASRLSLAERDEILASMTDEVGNLVLAHNYAQNLALANSVYQAPQMVHVHADWMERLSDAGVLDREIEFLPTDEEMESRRSAHKGLTSPELCTMLAWTKIALESEILASVLPDDPYLSDRLIGYFPRPLQETYAEAMRGHRLHREIVATVVVNEFVNQSGISCYHRLSGETGAGAADVVRAQIAARTIFSAAPLDAAIRALDHQIDAGMQTRLRMEVRTLVERATRWLVNNRRRPVDIAAAVDVFAAGVRQVQDALPTLLERRDREAYQGRLEHYAAADVPEDLALAVAVLPAAYAALTIVQTAARESRDPIEVAGVHFALGQQLGLDRLLTRIVELPRDDRWQTMARAALRDDMHAIHAQLTADVLDGGSQDATNPSELVRAWERGNRGVAESVKTLRSITAGRPDLARMSVGLRVVRGLLPAT
jgi:glutamate dehydrogenase